MNEIDFGDVEVGRPSVRTVLITNHGKGPLRIFFVESDLPGISVSADSVLVMPGRSERLQVRIIHRAEGLFLGEVKLRTNDPDRTEVVIPVSGFAIVIAADLRIDFNQDGQINLGDFISFAKAYGSAEAKYDLNGSGVVDLGDFILFAQSFGRPY